MFFGWLPCTVRLAGHLHECFWVLIFLQDSSEVFFNLYITTLSDGSCPVEEAFLHMAWAVGREVQVLVCVTSR